MEPGLSTTSGRVRTLARSALRALVLVLLATGCGNDIAGSNPPGSTPANPIPLSVGDTVSVNPTAQDAAVYYRLTPSEAMEIALFAAATSTAPTAFRLLTGEGLTPVTAVFPSPGAALLESRSSIAPLTAGRTYFIRVEINQPAAGANLRFLVYRVNRAPEHHPAALAVEEVVSDETLETSADIDEFTIPGSAGQEFIGFLQALDPSLEGLAQLSVGPASSGLDRSVRAAVGDPEATATGRFTLQTDGAVQLTVSAESHNWKPGPTQAGLVRIAIRAINRAPEQGGAMVAIGDTVTGGSIDFVGDIDQYTIQASAGSLLNVFLQAENDTAASVLSLNIVPNVTQSDGRAESRGTDQSLTTQATGRFLVPSTGVLTLEVAGYNDVSGLHRGGYRFLVYSVNRGPETAGSTITLGQAIAGETIELPGDLDEFTLHVSQATLANFVLTGAASGGIHLTRTAPNSEVLFTDLPLFPDASAPQGTDVAAGAGTFTLEAGTYRLAVDGLSSRGDGYRGAYGVQTLVLDSLPETAAASLTVESSVTDALTPVGDHDVYTLSGNAGDLVDLTLTATTGPATGIEAFVRQGGGAPMAGVTGAAAGVAPNHSGRFELPVTGSYQLFVGPINGGRQVSEIGPYQLGILRHPTNPEHSSSSVTTNVEVTSESLDSPGDVDDFTVTAAPGSEIQVLFKKGSTNGGLLQVHVADASSGTVLRSMESAGFDQATGRVTVPASGSLRLRFSEPRFPGCSNAECAYNVTDSYRFTPVLITRSPETAAAAIALGLVTEEAIQPVGDVDEFTFSGPAGQQVNVYFQSISLLASRGGHLQVLSPGGGTVLGSAQVGNPSGDIRNVGTGPITLPVTGTYLIRVQGESDRDGSGLYGILVE